MVCPTPTVPDTFGFVSQITSGPTTTSGAGSAVPPDGRFTRWADHREARRAELVRVARRAVHLNGPDVSMDEIATAAGTSKSIVYRYFTDKTGLQIALADAVLLQMKGALEGALRAAATPREGLRSMVAVYLEMVESSPHVYAFVTRQPESGAPMAHFLDAVTAMIAAPFALTLTEDRALAAGVAATAAGADAEPGTRADLDARTAAEALDVSHAMAHSWAAGAVGFVRGAGEWWMSQRGEPGTPTRADLTAQVTAWLWAGPVGLLARDRPRVDHVPPLPAQQSVLPPSLRTVAQETS